MGVLESSVAVRHRSADDVTDVFLGLMRDVGRRVESIPGPVDPASCGSEDVFVGPVRGGWVSVRPHYLVQADLLAVQLSRRLGTLASAVSIYEDVLWTHDLVDRGGVLDRYVNLPGYFGPGEYGPEHSGDPHLVAAAVGVEVAEIEPYFRQVSLRRARSRFLPPPKAHAADRFHLLDGWVVADLWARMGIAWVELPDVHARVPIGDEANWALNAWLRETRSSPEGSSGH